MSELVFDFEWLDPLGARGAELRATWARLTISVDGHVASRVFDQQSRTVREAVYLPLYPLAEWLATNWWPVCFEIGSPGRLRDPSYVDRHSLRAARDGYALPPISFTALGDAVQISWQPELLATHNVEFIESGIVHVPLEPFQRSLRNFIGAVAARLHEQGVPNTLLETEWDSLNEMQAEESEFCVLAAELGLDPLATDQETNEKIIEVATSVPESMRREFFAVATLAELSREARDIFGAVGSARENRADLRAVCDLRSRIDPGLKSDSLPPWRQGYVVARELREVLGLGNMPLPSFGSIADALGVSAGEIDSAIIDQPPTVVFDALVATNSRNSPAFAVSRRPETSARFQFCRGLYEFLGTAEQGPWLVTKAPSDRQRRNRAFAAEFLAPAEAIREQVSGSVISGDEVEDLAAGFGVSSYVIAHQLENHRIAAIASP
jgi:hypothetical protein